MWSDSWGRVQWFMRKLASIHRGVVAALALGCMAFSAAPITHAADDVPVIWVIAHKAVTVASLSRDDLRLIFQTRRTVWPDGSVVRPFNLMPTEPARQVFDRVVLGLTPDLMPRFWIDRRIRGESHPPKTVPTDATMLKVIRSLAGSVGYIAAPNVDSSVKVIARIVGEEVLAP